MKSSPSVTTVSRSSILMANHRRHSWGSSIMDLFAKSGVKVMKDPPSLAEEDPELPAAQLSASCKERTSRPTDEKPP